MTLRMFTTFTIVAAGIAIGAASSGTGATTLGVAYDSVTKFQPAGDAPPQPGTFAPDFQAASAVTSADDAPRGPFGLGKAVAAAKAAMAIFKTGSAEHHYVAGTKQRVDSISLGTAEIVDCSARTRTTLNDKKKAYTVTSLDRPVVPDHRGPARPQPLATDDGSKVSIALSTRALGKKPIEGTPTTGYDSTIKTTVTKASGESQTFDMDMTAYYSAFTEPTLSCPPTAASAATTGPAAGPMANYALAMRALRTSKGDPRITVTNAPGPTLPSTKFAMWELVSLKGEKGGAFNVMTERGNVRSVAENDPIFSIPADYSKTPDSL